MNIPKNKRILLFGILKETAIISFFVLVSYYSVTALREQIDIVNTNIQNNNEIDAVRDSYKETYDKYSKSTEEIINVKKILLSALPPTEDLREFLGILNTIASKNSVTANIGMGDSQIDTIKYEDIPLRTIPLTINIQGQKDNIRSYIADIEKLPYFFTITSLDEKSIDEASKKRVTTMTAKLWTEPAQVLTRTQSQ